MRFSCNGCMSIVALTMVGALIAGPRGLIAGFLFGVFWSLLFRRPVRRKQSNNERFREFLRSMLDQSSRTKKPEEAIHALTGLFMAVVRQNDRGLREIHIRMAQQILRVYAAQGGVRTGAMLNSFQQWETAEIPVKELAGRVNEHYPRSARKNFLHDMMMVAFADGEVREHEEGILRFLTEEFGFEESDFQEAKEKVRERLQYGRRRREGRRDSSRSAAGRSRQSLREAYDTLGLDPDADEDDVKSRYRELARKHHPDGISDDEKAERAQEKMIEINKAYKRIMDAQ